MSAVNMSYTSQLTINMSQHLNGSTIECFSDGERFFGSSEILLSSGKTLANCQVLIGIVLIINIIMQL